MRLYLTSFCNRLHCMRTGRPIEHECFLLPPAALRAEREDQISKSVSILAEARAEGRLRRHRGIRFSP